MVAAGDGSFAFAAVVVAGLLDATTCWTQGRSCSARRLEHRRPVEAGGRWEEIPEAGAIIVDIAELDHDAARTTMQRDGTMPFRAGSAREARHIKALEAGRRVTEPVDPASDVMERAAWRCRERCARAALEQLEAGLALVREHDPYAEGMLDVVLIDEHDVPYADRSPGQVEGSTKGGHRFVEAGDGEGNMPDHRITDGNGKARAKTYFCIVLA